MARPEVAKNANSLANHTARMHSQLYLSGRLAANPEVFATKKNKLWVKLLLETQLVRETSAGQFQSENVTLPVSFFAREAEAVRELVRGDSLTVGAHLYGTRFESDSCIKYGCQIVADQVFVSLREEVPS